MTEMDEAADIGADDGAVEMVRAVLLSPQVKPSMGRTARCSPHPTQRPLGRERVRRSSGGIHHVGKRYEFRLYQGTAQVGVPVTRVIVTRNMERVRRRRMNARGLGVTMETERDDADVSETGLRRRAYQATYYRERTRPRRQARVQRTREEQVPRCIPAGYTQ